MQLAAGAVWQGTAGKDPAASAQSAVSCDNNLLVFVQALKYFDVAIRFYTCLDNAPVHDAIAYDVNGWLIVLVKQCDGRYQ